MAANTSPIFPLTPNVGQGSISTANTARDGSGTVTSIFSAGSNGSLVTYLNVSATSTTTAGQVRIFIHNGSTFAFFEEIAVSAATPSATVQAFTGQSQKITPVTPLALPSGYSLRLSTHNGETFHVVIAGGDY